MRRSMPRILNTVERNRIRLREVRGLALWVAASIALHAGLLIVLPGTSPSAPERTKIVEVTLEKQEPPRALETSLPESREHPREARNPRVPAEKPPRASGQAERATAPAHELAPRPLLGLPKPAGVPDTPFTIPISPLPTPSADSTPRPEAAKSAPRSDPAARTDTAKSALPGASALLESKVTPPNFNAGYLRNPPPRYPLIARRNGEQGTVTLKVLVTREGLPAEISVQTSSGSASLDQAAVEAVKGWRFAPARQGAQAVEAWVLVPIVFKLEG